MGNFISIKIRERQDGVPGFVKAREFPVTINTDQVTLYNKGDEDPTITFVRLSCGVTLCVCLSEPKFTKLLKG